MRNRKWMAIWMSCAMAVSSLTPAFFAEEAGTEAAVQAEEAAGPAGSEQQEAAEARAEEKEQAQSEPAAEEAAAQEPAAEEAPAQPEAAQTEAAPQGNIQPAQDDAADAGSADGSANAAVGANADGVAAPAQGPSAGSPERQARKRRGHPAVLPPKGQAMHLRSKIRWRRLRRSTF